MFGYATPENEQTYYNSLKEIKATNRFYFTADFTFKSEVDFFYDLVGTYSSFSDITNIFPEFVTAFEIFLRKISKLDSTLTDKFDINVERIKDSKDQQKKLLEDIGKYLHIKFGYEEEAKIRESKEIKLSRDTSMFFNGLLKTRSNMFWVTISTNNKIGNDNTPLLSLVSPHMTLMRIIIKSLHGKDAILPHFTISNIEINDFCLQFISFKNKRYVQIINTALTERYFPHGFYSEKAIAALHDWYHLLVNSIPNEEKLGDIFPIRFQNLRKLLIELLLLKDYPMSPEISKLTDFDSPLHNDFKFSGNDKFLILNRFYFFNILNMAASGFVGKLDMKDHNLILLFSMITHRKSWNDIVGGSITTFLEDKNILQILPDMKRIVEDFSELSASSKSAISKFSKIKYLILMYRLKGQPKEQVHNLLRLLINNPEEVLVWEKKALGGLVFVHPRFGIKSIENSSSDKLLEEIAETATSSIAALDHKLIKNSQIRRTKLKEYRQKLSLYTELKMAVDTWYSTPFSSCFNFSN